MVHAYERDKNLVRAYKRYKYLVRAHVGHGTYAQTYDYTAHAEKLLCAHAEKLLCAHEDFV
jgi:hypothetical protein